MNINYEMLIRFSRTKWYTSRHATAVTVDCPPKKKDSISAFSKCPKTTNILLPVN